MSATRYLVSGVDSVMPTRYFDKVKSLVGVLTSSGCSILLSPPSILLYVFQILWHYVTYKSSICNSIFCRNCFLLDKYTHIFPDGIIAPTSLVSI